MEEIKVNLENLTEEERKLLMDLVKKENEEKLKIEYPKDGTKYYYIGADGTIHSSVSNKDIYKYEHNNFFLTYEEAKFEQEKQKVLFELKYCSGLYKFTYNVSNYHLYYNFKNNKIYIGWDMGVKNLNNIYFNSEKDALNAIKQVGENRIKKYLFEIED